jgi:hypothetical protein
MMGMTEAERQVVADAVVAGKIGKGDTVECLAGLFTVGAIERSAGDIHVVMLGRTVNAAQVEVAFRVGE